MIDSTATADAGPDSLGAGGEGRDTKAVWNLVIGAFLGFGVWIWSFPLCPILEQSCITFDQVA